MLGQSTKGLCMTVGSNQPYFFPYIAYWQLINRVDIFVLSDSMQYRKKGYINRNDILIDGKRHRYTLEVLGVHTGKLINEVCVGHNAKKILKSISNAYKKAPYFNEVYPMLEEICLNEEKNLAKYVGFSIERIARYLEMDTKFIYLSDLQGKTALKAQERTIDICKRLGADQYINAIGGQKLYSKKVFKEHGIKLNFIKTESVQYKQFHNAFLPNMSIIDIMMFNSREEIKVMLQKYVLI
ncbi:WbqC family protein [Sulfurimonas sp. HSL3-7]|uniref:WbqC family protein n=1 Tax=Sulfonitrofixus jiaomeiensis TaxID=3131938 RepID=UPI0031F81D88